MATKTIKEWFNTVEQPYREQLLNNTPKQIQNLERNSLQEAISGGFIWQYSEEGQKYWSDYCNTCVPRGTK